MTTGWTCPVCGAGVAPWVDRCVHATETKATGVVYAPEIIPTSGPELYGDGKGNFVKQSDDGWIEWDVSTMHTPNGLVDLTLRNGDMRLGVWARHYGWQTLGAPGDIIAYRVVRP